MQRAIDPIEQAARRAATQARVEAEQLARSSTPAEIQYQERKIEWMRSCNATAGGDTRRRRDCEMDGRQFSNVEIEIAQEWLEKCRAYAASQLVPA